MYQAGDKVIINWAGNSLPATVLYPAAQRALAGEPQYRVRFEYKGKRFEETLIVPSVQAATSTKAAHAELADEALKAIDCDIAEYKTTTGRHPYGVKVWRFQAGSHEKAWHGGWRSARNEARKWAHTLGVNTIKLLAPEARKAFGDSKPAPVRPSDPLRNGDTVRMPRGISSGLIGTAQDVQQPVWYERLGYWTQKFTFVWQSEGGKKNYKPNEEMLFKRDGSPHINDQNWQMVKALGDNLNPFDASRYDHSRTEITDDDLDVLADIHNHPEKYSSFYSPAATRVRPSIKRLLDENLIAPARMDDPLEVSPKGMRYLQNAKSITGKAAANSDDYKRYVNTFTNMNYRDVYGVERIDAGFFVYLKGGGTLTKAKVLSILGITEENPQEVDFREIAQNVNGKTVRGVALYYIRNRPMFTSAW